MQPTEAQPETISPFRRIDSAYEDRSGNMTDRVLRSAIAPILGLTDLTVLDECALSWRSFGSLVGETICGFHHSESPRIAARLIYTALPNARLEVEIPPKVAGNSGILRDGRSGESHRLAPRVPSTLDAAASGVARSTRRVVRVGVA